MASTKEVGKSAIATRQLSDVVDINDQLESAENDTLDCSANPLLNTENHTNHTRKVLKNSMEREWTSVVSLFLIMLFFLLIDSTKQISTFGVRLDNAGMYPFKPSIMVLISESSKLLFLVIVSLITDVGLRLHSIYVVPAVLFVANNFIYLYALEILPPPVWIVLSQMRIPLTAAVYRFAFNKKINFLQWLGLLTIVAAIYVTQLAQFNQPPRNFQFGIFLAVLQAVVSVSASIMTEYFLKNSDEPFFRIQTTIHYFTTVFTLLIAVLFDHNIELNLYEDASFKHVGLLLTLSILSNSVGGLTAAFIIKKLDNIVKIYTCALSSILTSFGCWYFYPNFFIPNRWFVASLSMMLSGIFLYEWEKLFPGLFPDWR